jgi:hypothetical protein
MTGRGQRLDSRSRAVDAQKDTVLTRLNPRKRLNPAGVATLLLLGAAVAFVPSAEAARGPRNGPTAGVGTSTIAGVVRDSQGVAQMGALVQVLAADSMTVATAFTDQHGRYLINKLVPGRYMVRASATLFVPASRNNLQLRTGATAVVNLTLAALFDTASWLPAQRRRADETEDDWKWTLRSTANRPILRIVEDGQEIEISSSATEQPAAIRLKAQEAVESGDGEFGRGGVHNIVTIHRMQPDGSDLMLRADLGTGVGNGLGQPAGPSGAGSEFDAGYEGRVGFGGGASRVVASYKTQPELVGAGFVPGAIGGSGFQVLEMTSTQRMSLGERVVVEAGGRMEGIHAGATAVVMHPFLRVSAHPAGEWTLEYRLSSDRELQGFDDVTSGDGEVPVALVRNGRLALETGHHQELSIARRSGRASVQVAIYHDGIGAAAVSGGESGGISLAGGPISGMGLVARRRVQAEEQGTVMAVQVPAGMLLDPTTGSFKALGTGYSTSGTRVTASSALTPSLWIAAEYSTGDALNSDGLAEVVGFENALGSLRAHWSQAATVALKGKLIGAGTRIRAAYRWEPVNEVTAVDPFSAFGDQAYLSCLIRQPIRLGRSGPQGLEATIDVTNLLAQGYRPFVSADGQTLYFAQAPRTIQAGLSFSF